MHFCHQKNFKDSPDLLDIAGIGASSDDDANGTVGSLVGASYQAACRVIEDRAHLGRLYFEKLYIIEPV